MLLTGPCLPDPSLGSPLGSVLQTLPGAPQLPLSVAAKTPRAARRFRASVTRGCPRAAGLPRTPRSAAGQAPGDPLCLLSSCPSGPRLTATCLLWPPENTLLERWGPLFKGLAGPHSLRGGWCDAEPRDKECPLQAWQRPQGPLSPGGHPAGVGNVASSVCKGWSSRLCRWGSLSAPHTWDAAPKAAHTHPKSRGQKKAWRKAGLSSSGARGSLHPARPQVHPEGQGPTSPHSLVLGELGAWPQGQRMSVSTASEEHFCRNTWRRTLDQAPGSGSLGPSWHTHRANVLSCLAVCFLGQRCTESYKRANKLHNESTQMLQHILQRNQGHGGLGAAQGWRGETPRPLRGSRGHRQETRREAVDAQPAFQL